MKKHLVEAKYHTTFHFASEMHSKYNTIVSNLNSQSKLSFMGKNPWYLLHAVFYDMYSKTQQANYILQNWFCVEAVDNWT